MARMIQCHKLHKEAEGLEFAPYPGALGQRIYDHISQEAWQMWQSHQTILINEYRLSLIDKQARDFLAVEMEKFLFGSGSAKPEAFIAPDQE